MTDFNLDDRYRLLFSSNVAGAALSTPAGRMVDCNDAFAESFGFASRAEVLTRSAWDYYLDRRDRDRVIQPDAVTENYIPQELAFRHRTARTIWFRFTRVVLSRCRGLPELLLVTAVDVTELRKLRTRIRQLSTDIQRALPPGTDTTVEVLIQEVFGQLQSINILLRPENLKTLSKPDLQQFVRSVERMKVILGELAIKQLQIDPEF